MASDEAAERLGRTSITPMVYKVLICEDDEMQRNILQAHKSIRSLSSELPPPRSLRSEPEAAGGSGRRPCTTEWRGGGSARARA